MVYTQPASMQGHFPGLEETAILSNSNKQQNVKQNGKTEEYLSNEGTRIPRGEED